MDECKPLPASYVVADQTEVDCDDSLPGLTVMSYVFAPTNSPLMFTVTVYAPRGTSLRAGAYTRPLLGLS